MEFRILGPLEVEGAAGPVRPSAYKQRALLALLLLHAGQVVSVDRLVDALWGAEPPRTAEPSLQNLIAQLRRLIGPQLLLTRSPGYVLAVDPGSIDAVRFERLVAEARSAEAAARSVLLAEALALWRGQALDDVAFEAFAATEIARLEDLRLEAHEERIQADLERGQGVELVAEIEALAREHPLRERLRAQHMLALYRAGRQADALASYEQARRLLDDRLGVGPGPLLAAAHRAILRQERGLLAAPLEEEEPDHVAAVGRALLAGRLVIVLGAGLARASGEDGDDATVAEHLARRFDCPPRYAGDLARVAEYVALTHGVGPLYDELHGLHDRDDTACPVHRSVASIAGSLAGRGPPPLLVTTDPGEALEQALDEAGVAHHVVAYLALGPYRGRFVHVAPGGDVRVVDVPNSYAHLPPDAVVVLKVHGRVDRQPAREWESFAISEDDHIDYLAQSDVAGLLPVTVAARLRRSHFLFLGYPLRDWSLRVFLHRVFGRERLAYRSWAVAADADALERQLWSERAIEALALPPERFAAALDRHLPGALP